MAAALPKSLRADWTDAPELKKEGHRGEPKAESSIRIANVRMVDVISVTPVRVRVGSGALPRITGHLRGGNGLCPPGGTYQGTLCVRDAEGYSQRREVHKESCRNARRVGFRVLYRGYRTLRTNSLFALVGRLLCAMSGPSITAQYANPRLSCLARYLGRAQAELLVRLAIYRPKAGRR